MKKTMFIIWIILGILSLGLLITSISDFLTGDMKEIYFARKVFIISLCSLILSIFTVFATRDDDDEL